MIAALGVATACAPVPTGPHCATSENSERSWITVRSRAADSARRSRYDEIKQAIEDAAQVHGPRASTGLGRWQQQSHDAPLTFFIMVLYLIPSERRGNMLSTPTWGGARAV